MRPVFRMAQPQEHMDIPEWFNDAIRATQENYRRIDTSRRVCCLCGHNVMVATERILRSEDPPLRNRWQPEIYSFCACAQAITLRIQEPGVWEDMARLYHQKIALPISQEHRQNMLRGEPNPKLPEIHILGRAVEDS
jgi:hypothetical protein